MTIGGEEMKINLKINEKYKVPEIHICGSENTAELRNLYHTVKEAVEENLIAYKEREAVPIRCGDVLRIFSQNKLVYIETLEGQFRIRERLYEMEEKLNKINFVRVSNSEIVNLRKIKRMDTGTTGTIKMYLQGNIETYVSRRYVSKIKTAFQNFAFELKHGINT